MPRIIIIPPVALPEEPQAVGALEIVIWLRDGERQAYATSTLANDVTIHGIGRTLVTDQEQRLTLWTSDEIPGYAYYDVSVRTGRETARYTIVLPPGDDLQFWEFLQLHAELDLPPRADCRQVPCATNLPDGYFASTANGHWIASETDPGGGVTDHGNLTGLDADDHPHYHTDTRGDVRYTPIAHDSAASPHSGHLIDVQAGANITIDRTDPQRPEISSAGGGVTSHGDLTDLGADDHLQYHTDARGDVRYTPIAHDSAASPHSGHLIDVQAGANITIDRTDPQRPEISSTSGFREPWRVVLSDGGNTIGTETLVFPVAHDGTISKIELSCDPNDKPTGTASSAMVRRVDIATGTKIDLLTANVSLLNAALAAGSLGATRDVTAGVHAIEVEPMQDGGTGSGYGIAVYY